MGETCSNTQTRLGRKRVLQSPVKPHFFQPLLPGFLHNFCIPKSFLNKYLNLKKLMTKDKAATNIIRLRSQGRRRTRWKVKVEVGEDEKVQFNKGWKKFASDNDLCVGDFLVFKYRGRMVFDVVVFAPTGCERDHVMDVADSSISARGDNVKPFKRSKKNCDKNDTTHEAAAFVPSSYPYYRTTIQPSCYTWPGIVIPRNFLNSHLQIIKDGVDEITLIDEQQRSWELSLRYRKHGTVAIGSGWKQFQAAKGLKPGDSVIFELIESGPKVVMKFYKVT